MAQEIRISTRNVARWLGGVAALLILANCAVIAWVAHYDDESLLDRVDMFVLDYEANLPTWFSAGLLLYAGILLAFVAVDQARRSAPFVGRWRFLAGVFVYLSIDEATSIHELAGPPLREMGVGGIFYYAWILPAAVLLLVMGAAYLPFLRALARPLRNRFLLSAAVYLGGAMGLEMMGGWYVEQNGPMNVTYGVIITLEEVLEIVGMLLFVDGLAREIAARDLRVSFS